MKMKISVVMPAYDEAGNVEKLAERFYRVFKKLNIDFELLYVLQGTKEKSGYNSLIQMKKKGMSKIRTLYYPGPIGVGPAFRAGFDAVSRDATHVLTLDADLNHQPEELPMFIAAMEKTDKDIIIGSRYIKGGKMEGMPLWKVTLSKWMNKILSILTGLWVKDKTSGYRLYKRKVIDKIKNKTVFRNFEYYPELLICAKKAGFSMYEVPIIFKWRVIGKSKMKKLKTIIGYLRLLGRVIAK